MQEILLTDQSSTFFTNLKQLFKLDLKMSLSIWSLGYPYYYYCYYFSYKCCFESANFCQTILTFISILLSRPECNFANLKLTVVLL